MGEFAGDFQLNPQRPRWGVFGVRIQIGKSIYTGVSAADRWPGARRSDDPGRGTRHEREDILERYARLTARERDVLKHVVSGQLNEQITADLRHPGVHDQGPPRAGHEKDAGSDAGHFDSVRCARRHPEVRQPQQESDARAFDQGRIPVSVCASYGDATADLGHYRTTS